MTPTPCVTLLLPVRDAMPFLGPALRSLAGQTHRELYVIAWDNGSTDGSLGELRRWIPERIPGRIVSDRPLPLGRCLAEMVKLAPTELCARMDADDVARPDRIARQLSTMAADPSLAVIGGQHEFIDERGERIPGAWGQPLDDATIRWRLRWRNSLNHSTVMFRRSVVLAAGNYRECGPFEDHDLWLRVARRGAMLNSREVLVQYRRRGGSVTANSDFAVLSCEVARLNADTLFPGVEAGDALRLRRAAGLDCEEPAQLRDMAALRAAAIGLARDAALDEGYFRRSSWYRAQQRSLLRRWAPIPLVEAHRLLRRHLGVSPLREVPHVD